MAIRFLAASVIAMSTPTRSTTGRFAAGTSGNPSGRSSATCATAREIAIAISERTGNGLAIVDRLIELAIDSPATNAATQRNAIAALAVLLDRLVGRAPGEITVIQPSTAVAAVRRMRALTDAELELLARMDDLDAEIAADLASESPTDVEH